jgi:Flp pilus assembly protein TadD
MIKVVLLSLLLVQSLFAIHPVRDAYKWVSEEYKDFRTYPRIDRAYKLIKIGEDKEARELLEKALEIDPGNKSALNPLISLCLKYNDKECIAKYVDSLKDSDLAYFSIYNAQASIDADDYLSAYYYSKEALKYDLRPKDRYFSKLILIESCIRLEKFDEASSYIDKLYYSKTMPKYEKYHLHLVRLSILAGRLDLGKKEVNKLIEAGNIPTDTQLLRWSRTSDNLGDTKYAYYLASRLSSTPKHLEWQVDLLTKLEDYKNASKKMELLYLKRKTTKNKKRLVYLYTLAGNDEKIAKVYEDKLSKGCNEYALLYLLDYYKHDRDIHNRLLLENYPYSCVKDKKRVELLFEYIVLIEKTNPKAAKDILLSIEQEGVADDKLYLRISNIYSLLGDCKSSIKYAQKQLDLHPDDIQALKNAGYCYDRLSKKGMSGYYLSHASKLHREDTQLVKSLGYIYMEIERPRKALRYWNTYLNTHRDTKVRLSSAITYYDLNMYSQSKDALDIYDEEKGEENFEYYSLKARLGKVDSNCSDASLNYEKALYKKKSEYLTYEYASLLRGCKDIPKAISLLEQLAITDADNLQYKKELGYLYVGTEEYDKAAEQFEYVSKVEPRNRDNLTELAYIYKRLGKNKNAEVAFKSAIDNSNDIDEEKIYMLKSEVKSLNKRFDIYFAQTFRLDDYNNEQESYVSPISLATYDGSGGLTLSYRPEYFNDYLAIFAEVLHSHSGNFSDSAQTSIGVKFKPLKEYGWVVSAQKMFDTGELTRDELFLRTSASFLGGYEYKFSPKKYYYQNLYLDAGYYTQKKSTILFGNYEFGKVYKMYKQVSMLPYIAAGGTYSNDNKDKEGVTKLDAAIGISMLNWFNETKYEPYMFTTRLKLEGRVKYAGNSKDVNTIRLQFEFIY